MLNNKLLSNGNKRAQTKGCSVQILGYTSNTHFTTMGITALTREPVCAVVIIQQSTELNFIENMDLILKQNGKDICLFLIKSKRKLKGYKSTI